MIKVSHVPREHINDCWKEIEGYLKKCADYTYGRYKVEDIYLEICQYNHELWIAYDEDKIKGAVVTNLVIYPRKKCCSMTFCGGEDFDKWKDIMLDLLKKWAKDNNCDSLEAVGRLGWTKIFKSDGHKPLFNTFELPL